MSASTSGRVSLRISLQPSRPWKSSSSDSSRPCSMAPIAPSAMTTRWLTASRSACARTGRATESISSAKRRISTGYVWGLTRCAVCLLATARTSFVPRTAEILSTPPFSNRRHPLGYFIPARFLMTERQGRRLFHRVISGPYSSATRRQSKAKQRRTSRI